MKKQKESFRAEEHLQIWGEQCAWRGHRSYVSFPHTLPCAFLPAGYFKAVFFYNKQVI